MAGYTPVFDSVFEGSLCGKYPETAAWLFLLALADKNGHVDKSPTFISAVTGMPVDVLERCIGEFCEPDEKSRTPDSDGRRLIPLDPERPWGWLIVNHGKYREKARKASYDAARTASGADAARKRDERASVPTRPAMSRADPLSDADADSNTDLNKAEESAAFDISECPRDMDAASEHKRFVLWCAEKGQAPTGVKWSRWIVNAKQSGKYAKQPLRRPTDAECAAERARIAAAQT